MYRNRWTAAAACLLAVALLPAGPAAAAGPCPADLNHDGKVSAADLLILRQAWSSSFPPADINGDGKVGCVDQAMLIAAWGPCPTKRADLNGDGKVNNVDKALLEKELGNDCRFDLDHSGIVGPHDAEALMCLWGTAGPAGDFNGDHRVNATDLLMLERALGTDCKGDLNENSFVDGDDIEILIKDIDG